MGFFSGQISTSAEPAIHIHSSVPAALCSECRTWLAGCDPLYTTHLAGCDPLYTTHLAGCDPLYTTHLAGCDPLYTTHLAGCDPLYTTHLAGVRSPIHHIHVAGGDHVYVCQWIQSGLLNCVLICSEITHNCIQVLAQGGWV